MSNNQNTALLEELGDIFQQAYEERDFTAMDAVIGKLNDMGFASQATELAREYIDLQDGIDGRI